MNRLGDPRYEQPHDYTGPRTPTPASDRQAQPYDAMVAVDGREFEIGIERGQPTAPTFIAVLDKTQDLDGRLSALVNELLELDARLNGATPENHQKVEPDEAPPAGTLAQLCRVTDNMYGRLHLLGSVVGRLKGSLG